MPREAGSLLGLKVSRDSFTLRSVLTETTGSVGEDGGTSDLIVHLSRLCVQVVGGKMTETGRLGAFITKVKKGSLADVVGHLRAGAKNRTCCSFAGVAELQTVMLLSRNACEINLCRDISMYLSSLQA